MRIHNIVLIVGLAARYVGAQATPDVLERGFLNPPDSAKPRVWWHWMNGNITKEGIKLDLEWMKRAGIGGFQNFDAALMTPQIVEKRLTFMTPAWKDAFRYTATLADKLGLEMAIAGSPGWSESGGPWVTSAQAMKKFVWSETPVEGGRPFTGTLPKPPSTTGPFQNIPGSGPLAALLGQEELKRPEHYADAAVVAYRPAKTDVSLAQLNPKVTWSGGSLDSIKLMDGDFATAQILPKAPMNERAWIQFEFAQPQTIRAFTLAIKNPPRNPFGPAGESGQVLEASDNGSEFRAIAKVPGGGAAVNTVAFTPLTARFFRMTFLTMRPGPRLGEEIPGLKLPPVAVSHEITELVLYPGARVNRAEEKAGFATLPELYSIETPATTSADAISISEVIDLTSKMRPDGTLDWTPTEGRWVVLRLGYSLLGITNHPASPEATGFEVDKLSRKFVKSYIDNYLGQYKGAVGPLMGKRGLQYLVTDSWEAGSQNWTDDMPAEFKKRRGYDMHPWIPVLIGRIVESAGASERFLWDFRKTIGELTVENHYEQIGASLHARGMGRYSESHESGRAFIGDGMDVKRKADIPMSAMWTPRPGETGENYGGNADIRESASVAHIYGQNIAAAESLTAIGTAWQWSPEMLKPTADKELANGLNRFVIHTSVHQPVSDRVPGLGLGPFGQWFTRHETWAELAKPWTTYLARSSYMLQEGKFVADVAYFYGEDSNITALFRDHAPDVPSGFNFDYVSADALVNRLSASNGRITTPSGMSYRALALDPNSRFMSVSVVRKIRQLVNGGAKVVGSRPVGSPSLSDDPAEFRAIVDQLWGEGKIDANRSLTESLAAMGEVPDFEYTKLQADTVLLFVHRRLPDAEVYWVNNRNQRVEQVEATFRVSGKEPELWNPVTGTIEPASYRFEGGRTMVPLRLDPNDAMFIVFRKAATASSRVLPVETTTELAFIDGPWDVSFQPGRGAPEKTVFDKLASWTQNADNGVKYFSGSAVYTKGVDAPTAWFKAGSHLWLDLGDVKNLAEVSVNGKPLGVLWKAPFRVEVTNALKPGENHLQVRITNLWVNRLIGDQQPGITQKVTYTTQPFYRANSPLLPSGLIGPVRLARRDL